MTKPWLWGSVPEAERALARAIDIVATRCPRGLKALTGDSSQPTEAELRAAVEWDPEGDDSGRHGQSSGDGPVPREAVKLMDVLGPIEYVGWDAVVQAVNYHRVLSTTSFEAYQAYASAYGAPIRWRTEGGGMVQAIASRLGISPRTYWRRKSEFPLLVAHTALFGPLVTLDYD